MEGCGLGDDTETGESGDDTESSGSGDNMDLVED